MNTRGTYLQQEILGKRETSIPRLIVEFLFYFSIVAKEFGQQLGVLQYQGLSGAIILMSGIICFIFMILGKHRIPYGFYVVTAITFLTFLTVLRVFGAQFLQAYEVRPLISVVCQILMASYILRDKSACVRCILFFVLCIICASKIGAIQGGAVGRMRLEGVGSTFADANDLAYFSAITASMALFFGLISSKKTKSVLWLFSLVCIYVMLRTVSRGALFFFGLSALVFFVAIVLGKGNKIMMIAMILIAILLSGKVAYQLYETREAYIERAHQDTARRATWKAMPADMFDTIVFGRSAHHAYVEETGVEPHNTFFYIHIAYGALAAWIYASWIILLSIRTVRMFFAHDYTIHLKMLIVGVFIVTMGNQMMSNLGIVNYATIVGLVIVDNYVYPYKKKNILARRYQQTVN